MARRARREESPLEKADERFEGTRFSNPECLFLIEHLGEAPIVAISDDEDLPDGVNEAQIRPLLQRTFELELYQESLREKHGDPDLTVWCGFDKLKEILQETLDWNAAVAELKKRSKGAPAEIRRASGAPSLHLWDPDTDIPYLGGEGADAGIVLTALDRDGGRIPLHCELKESGIGAIKSLSGVLDFMRATKGSKVGAERIAQETPNALLYHVTEGQRAASVECPICGTAESYDSLKATSKRKAITAIRKHLQIAKTQKSQHRLLLTRLQSGKAGTGARRAVADVEEAEA